MSGAAKIKKTGTNRPNSNKSRPSGFELKINLSKTPKKLNEKRMKKSLKYLFRLFFALKVNSQITKLVPRIETNMDFCGTSSRAKRRSTLLFI